ncbi:hypothetical protein K040078D81_18970 [Blautia hominis]|uniref:Uncharacterized protein n=1 Tax=Blautia hominis TaxID=2025493 RepID=A0ABQ0B8J6_9FIRM
MAKGDFAWIFACNCEGTEQLLSFIIVFLAKLCNEKENSLRGLGKTGIMLRKENYGKREHRGSEVHG